MAYDFDLSDYLSGSTNAGSFFDGGGTMSCWIQCDTYGGSGERPLQFNYGAGSNQVVAGVQFYIESNTEVNFLYSWNDYASQARANTLASNGIVFDGTTWSHALFTYNADSYTNQATIYINGVDKTAARSQPSSSHTRDPLDDEVIIGIDGGKSIRGFDGRIGEVACWDVILTQDEITALGVDAISAELIRPAHLKGCWPLIDLHDRCGGASLTNTGPAPRAAHPRIIKPSAQIIQFPSAGVAGFEPQWAYGSNHIIYGGTL